MVCGKVLIIIGNPGTDNETRVLFQERSFPRNRERRENWIALLRISIPPQKYAVRDFSIAPI